MPGWTPRLKVGKSILQIYNGTGEAGPWESGLVFIVICMLVFSAFSAQAAPGDEITLEPMVVTATRAPLEDSQVAANVTVLDQEELENLPAHDVAEALAFVPGVFVDQIGGMGSQATISIYGSDYRHVAVFIDGVPLNMLANPMTDLSRLPLDRVARIEIYKGDASSVWGSALGGVVNIITKEPEGDAPITGHVRVGAGEYDTYRAGAGIQGRMGKTGFLFNGGHTRSEGFDEYRDYNEDHYYLKLTHDFSSGARVWFAGALDKSEAYDPTLLTAGMWESGLMNRNYQSLNLEHQLTPELDFKIGIHRQALEANNDLCFADASRVNSFTYGEYTWGTSIQATHAADITTDLSHTLTLGGDGEWGEYNYSLLGRDISSRNLDLWFSEVINLGPASLNLGLRLDDNQDFGSEISPAAGVVFRVPSVPVRLRLQWAQGFSAPPLSYLYHPLAGNPELGPEKGQTWQAGLESDLTPWLQAGFNYYQADLKDMIYYDPIPGRLVNLDEIRRTGLEANLRLDLFKQVTIKAGGTWVEVINLRTGEEIPDIPSRKFDVGITHKLGALTQTLNGRCIDYNSSMINTRDMRWILDYQINYDYSDVASLKFFIHNLTDEEEYHYWFLPHGGRWVEMELAYYF